tara:strand:+ start:328 stop:558 length:231 start_codon:yes stop_codon:yes gene_type:complete
LVKKHPFKLKNLIFFYLKFIKVPNKITPQQTTIAEKIPVLIKVVFLVFNLLRILILEIRIYISEYTHLRNCQTNIR